MPDTPAASDEAARFTAVRAHLVGVGYRLTGSLADAEDAVQDAWLRLTSLDDDRRAAIHDLTAWLTTVVARLCLDRLRSAATRRERYVGPWLPEPVVTATDGRPDPLEAVVADDGARMAAMVVLDTLPPEQRLAFVLHDAFGVPFAEIAETLGCSSDAARQYASRGRRTVRDADPPPRAGDDHRRVVEQLLTAMATGDVQAVARVLHPDVVLIGDSDGKARTARRVMSGADRIARFFVGLLTVYRPGAFAAARPVMVNGDLGVYLPPVPGGEGYHDLDAHVQTVAVAGGRIVAIYDQVNPDKLTRLPSPPA
ncbi:MULTISPECIES: sigma-70 family RNA polymerase sigma factor [Prauserella salsuginis group]|uniref:RNA polymerase sigma-70 factor (ECF subfamily) n=2 Tax=Prauserella salsuginis group TaxID=2893672 RepID=A0A839XRQ1_9PSEU|nr:MULTISPECIES: sigma-70 family RNA polymerase sigma factor [Prauserella salsuginis group]MBB3665397.1 RNA polymerase sigma-70 factor (ECF subfamily) [Prauserella sediminis]MCR3718679.1 RNA polymerase sigma-70 factor, ECF subfamily [Prauserella flava]MCR3733249.1 RNA polymerase sigma-70 factor, ECF subfamily [Prauserella salsuginis]